LRELYLYGWFRIRVDLIQSVVERQPSLELLRVEAACWMVDTVLTELDAASLVADVDDCGELFIVEYVQFLPPRPAPARIVKDE